MTIRFETSTGALLAEVDSDTIFSDRIKATLHACPECQRELGVGRDDGHWYLVGTDSCSTCRGLYAMPTEAELADMLRKAERS